MAAVPGRSLRRVFALLVVGLLGSPRPHAAAEDSPLQKTVVVGAQYAAGGVHRSFFGADYRDLWTTPVAVEVLDLGREADGLRPVRRVGGVQTKGLALKGADGRNYTFRGLDKDVAKFLELVDPGLKGTIVESFVRDQLAAQHPAGELVAGVLLEAAGIPAPRWRLVVLPDDAALLEFRSDFAGVLGVFGEYPSPVSESNPGFRGATEIVDHLELYRRLDAGPEPIDDRALLRARLMDILMGDWDRHRKQWRWAKLPGSASWQPIPEDRDQAFSRYEGLVADLIRPREPRFQKFRPRYAGIDGLTFNAWDQDRRLLAGLSRDDFREAADTLRGRISDAVIDAAVKAMPPEWQAIEAARLAAALRARRDALPEVAERFYRHLAERTDVYLTHRAEHVEAHRLPSGDLELRVRVLGEDRAPSGEPTYERRFQARDTREVRVYARDGNDRVQVTGPSRGIRLRVIGGNGDDSVEASPPGGVKLSDSAGRSRAEGADLDAREYTPPPPPQNAPWVPPRDWGSQRWTVPWLSYGADLGVFLGAGIEKRGFGFRRDPYASRHVLRAGFSFGETSGRVDYTGEFRRENRGSWFGLYAYGSGVDVMRFYGFGNETPGGDADFFKASANQFLLYPALTLPVGEKGSFTIGPAAKYTRRDAEGRTEYIDVVKPYGTDRFGELALHGVLAFDTRDNVAYPRRGVFAAARGTLFPEAWDVTETFGQVNGNVNAYLSAGQAVTLALRVGGKKVFGSYPYMEAAQIGGAGLGAGSLAEPHDTLRGFRAQRFSGDASAWGNADLRLRLGRVSLLVPAHFGVFGFADSGRVWLEGESSDTWHAGFGGGVWFSLLAYRSTFSAGLAHSEEGDLFYFRGGFTF